MLSTRSKRATKVAHPRASLLALSDETLTRIVQLAAPLTDDDEFDMAEWLASLRRIACTCRAMHLAAHLERSRHVVLRAPTTLNDAPLFPAYLRIDAQDRPLDLKTLAVHIGWETFSLRLYLESSTTVDLSALGLASHLRRLTLSNGKLSATNVARLPTNLVELELLDVKCAPALVNSLIRGNSRLETVHLTPVDGAKGLHAPGKALATLKHVKFLQYGPPRRVDAVKQDYKALLAPFAAQVAKPLVLVHHIEHDLPDLPADSVERLVVYYPFDSGELKIGSEIPHQLVRLADWISSASNLDQVALPASWHPTAYLEDPFERGVQLAFNAVVNTCVDKNIYVAFYDLFVRPRGASLAPLCDELRTGVSSEPEIVWLDEALLEWPGSWAALLDGLKHDGQWVVRSAGGEVLDVGVYGSEDESEDEMW
ncbi:hypothetical protein JCM9279_005743 [Rhodotorula babjevae]